jgi:hypothetical protein
MSEIRYKIKQILGTKSWIVNRFETANPSSFQNRRTMTKTLFFLSLQEREGAFIAKSMSQNHTFGG